MPLINTAVPNLIQGVSQQPDATRFAGQCEEQENALSSVADGLKKRPNTRHLARLLTSAIDSNSFIHFIDRDDNEKYILIHDGNKISTFNINNGNEASINTATGGYTPSASDYLYSTNPRADLKAMTVGDSTFIVNTTKTVSESSTLTSSYDRDLAGFFVKQGAYGQEYNVNITSEFSLTPIIESSTTFTPTTSGVSITEFNYGGNTGNVSNPTPTTTDWAYTDSPTTFERITGFNIENNTDGVYNSSNPLRLWYKYIFATDSARAAQYIEITAGYDIVYDDVASKIKSITAKPLTDANAALQYIGSFQLFSIQESSTFEPDQYEIIPSYLALDATTLEVTPVGLLRSSYTPTSSSTNAKEINTLNIAKHLVFGTARQTSPQKDTFGNANSLTGITDTNGNFQFKSLSPQGNRVGESFYSSGGQVSSSTFFLEHTLGKPFDVSVSDGLSGEGLGLFYKEIDSLSSLPLECKKDYAIEIIGDAELNQDNYYVKFQTNTGQAFGNGTWVERAGFNISTGLDSSTMPHRIINSAVDTFKVEAVTYKDREAGDDDTNPHPSFVGNQIMNLFLYKDRLGFVSNENVIMSGSGDLFNFYRKTVTTLLDDAPIDVSVASGRVLNLSSAVGFQENLILFGDNGQFALKGGDILTPRTVSVTPITNFSLEDNIDPLPLGSYIYFPFTRGAFTGMREFTVNGTTDNYDSTEVTEHVPAYVPKNIIDMAGTTSEDIIVLLSGDEKGSLYIYNYFWNNNQKVLSAWSKFTFSGEIRGIQFVDSTLYMVTTDDQSNTHLVSLSMEADAAEVDHNGDAAPFRTLLDRRVRAKMTSGSDLIEFEQSDGTYSSANGDLPYTYFSGSIPAGGVTLSEVFVDSTGTTHAVKALNTVGTRVHLTNGNASSTLYGYVGVPYTMKYKFSTQVFKAQSGNSASPTNASEMQVRNGTVFFSETNSFDVKVTPEHRSTATSTFSANDRPEADQLGAIKFAEGNFRFPVYSKAKHADILIENSSPFDSKFSSAEFESFVHPRSRRYG